MQGKVGMTAQIEGTDDGEDDLAGSTQNNRDWEACEEEAQRGADGYRNCDTGRDEHREEQRDMAGQREGCRVERNFNGGEHGDEDTDGAQQGCDNHAVQLLTGHRKRLLFCVTTDI